MELSPQSVASTTFKTVKKGYDPDEVRAYLAQLATAIESTQAQATAMEARARAAVARLQELAANSASNPATNPAASTPASAVRSSVDEAETISRTLLLAQRTADTTVAEAEAEALRIREEATAHARETVESAHELQTRLVEEAKADARRAAEGARIEAESEVQSLLARRDFLLSDVDHLEQHVVTHRDRLREVAGALNAIVDRGPGGLADLRRPLMSAVAEADAVAGSADESPASDGSTDPAETNGSTGSDGSSADATQPMSRVDLSSEQPDEPVADTVEPAAERRAADDTGPIEVTATADKHRPADVTPAAGVEGGLFDEVTSEVPAVARPSKDAFRIRGNDRR
jgi:DivIVA domain-containing protein